MMHLRRLKIASVVATALATAAPSVGIGATRPPQAEAVGHGPSKAPPEFQPAEHAASAFVSTWRSQAADELALTSNEAAALQGNSAVPAVPRCIKLNNYWCIKKAGWAGEIAADGEGHVAFASAVEGAAVAAVLLKRYYVDFGRRTALAIISRWAPAQCGLVAGIGPGSGLRALAPRGIGRTLRARWLASHSLGFTLPRLGSTTQVRRSVVADHVGRPEAAPTIAVGLGERGQAPMTLDALMMSSPNAPPSRSMIGMPRRRTAAVVPRAGAGSQSACGSGRVAAYAAAAAAGIKTGADGDLALFAPDGKPTPNLATLMANMAHVEIGPFGAKPELVAAGIAEAFRPGRNPDSGTSRTSVSASGAGKPTTGSPAGSGAP